MVVHDSGWRLECGAAARSGSSGDSRGSRFSRSRDATPRDALAPHHAPPPHPRPSLALCHAPSRSHAPPERSAQSRSSANAVSLRTAGHIPTLSSLLVPTQLYQLFSVFHSPNSRCPASSGSEPNINSQFLNLTNLKSQYPANAHTCPGLAPLHHHQQHTQLYSPTPSASLSRLHYHTLFFTY